MTDLERDASPRVVEFVPFPDAGPPLPLGSVPLEDDPPPPSPWMAPGIILVMLAVALVAAVAALSAGRDDRPSEVADRSLTIPAASVPDGPRPTSDASPVSVLAEVATTVAPTTVAPNGTSTVNLPDGWVQFIATDGDSRVELPGSPEESSERVRTPTGTVTRVERLVALPGGTIGIGSVSRPDADSNPDDFLTDVARSAAQQLGGDLQLGSSGPAGRGRSLDFVVDYPGGQLRARAVMQDGRLHLVTATGDSTVDAVFERVRASFTPT